MKRRECLLWGLYLILAGFLAWFVALLPKSGRDAAVDAAVKAAVAKFKERLLKSTLSTGS